MRSLIRDDPETFGTIRKDPEDLPNFFPHECGTTSLKCGASDSLGRVRCRVCQHATRSAIEAACRSTPIRIVASSFGLSAIALDRHLSLHCAASSESGVSHSSSDESPATSRSPSFVRSIGDLIPESARQTIFGVLSKHPDADRDVREALEMEVA